jgi:flagellar hook-length control protein FliK
VEILLPVPAALAAPSTAPAPLAAALGAAVLGLEDPFAAVLARELALASFPLQAGGREERGAEAEKPQASDPKPGAESATPTEDGLATAPLPWAIPLEPYSSSGRPISAPEAILELPEASARACNEERSQTCSPSGAVPGESLSPGAAPRDAPMTPSSTPPLGTEPRLAPLPVTAPVSSPRFGEEFSRQVVWIATQELQQAELRLDPPELGPVRVVIHVRESEATAVFSALHPQTREAIEAALPRLRDMLAEAGIALGGATVSAEGFEGRRGFAGDRPPSPLSADGGRSTETSTLAEISSRRRHGLVDLFA